MKKLLPLLVIIVSGCGALRHTNHIKFGECDATFTKNSIFGEFTYEETTLDLNGNPVVKKISLKDSSFVADPEVIKGAGTADAQLISEIKLLFEAMNKLKSIP